MSDMHESANREAEAARHQDSERNTGASQQTEKLEESVRRLHFGEREIVLVGTAHVSRESVEDVERLLEDEEPDEVCVEIDQARYRSLTQGSRWTDLNIYEVIREKKAFLLLGNLVLSSFQKRIGMDLGVKPGEEMIAAVRAAESHNVPVTLCDRELPVTLRRAWSKTGLWGKSKLLAALLSSLFTREKFSADEIEALKEKNALETMMGELASYLPSVKEVLIDERDRYLATKIFRSNGKKLLAVLGAGHVPGVVQWLERLHNGEADTDLSDIERVPPRRTFGKILPWILPAVIVGLIAWGFVRSGWQGGLEILGYWIIVNGTLSGLGALAALAHPITIITSVLAAPFTSMNPTIGVGFVAGILEAVVRKPRVKDFESLQEDILSVRGFFRNRVTHILIVFFLSSVGSAIGTFVALPFLFPGVAA
jgi:pheromone shutdown-related protein TraB